ncbi:MAG: B-glycosyltransferase, glycosyltransferase family 2 protein [uncultured bacterium]|nr:MAG: B-glycosyltransferase, glycosyltransferase family 2 protein [uncultured bacterium]
MDISVIILNYKSERYLDDCIESIRRHASDVEYEIIIVNNDADPLKNIWSEQNIQIINNTTNEGFSSACNKGAKIANGKALFFLNPDTEIKTGNISELLSAFENSAVGIVAPQLILTDGKVQPWSAGHEVTLWDTIRNNFGYVRSEELWNATTPTRVDWVSGAGLIIEKSLFKSINGFDENFFMYFEDVDLCKKVSLLEKKVLLMPSVKILHFGGQSFLNDERKQKRLYYDSQDYYFKKHFGRVSVFLLRFLRNLSLIFKKF